ncbi:hypothetical protein EI94DRAFT_750485 [Lactarius quietus]|nr:hypothetical protein EI94DRAFT_750485 [Lactarius quietus]
MSACVFTGTVFGLVVPYLIFVSPKYVVGIVLFLFEWAVVVVVESFLSFSPFLGNSYQLKESAFLPVHAHICTHMAVFCIPSVQPTMAWRELRSLIVVRELSAWRRDSSSPCQVR